MRCVVLTDSGRVYALLREHRPWHAGEREQEQQDEGRPHGRQLPPAPAHPAGFAEPATTWRGWCGRACRQQIFVRRQFRHAIGRGHVCVTLLISDLSCVYVAPPTIRAAMRPSRSITSVVGIAAGGTVLRNASAISSDGSLRLG